MTAIQRFVHAFVQTTVTSRPEVLRTAENGYPGAVTTLGPGGRAPPARPHRTGGRRQPLGGCRRTCLFLVARLPAACLFPHWSRHGGKRDGTEELPCRRSPPPCPPAAFSRRRAASGGDAHPACRGAPHRRSRRFCGAGGGKRYGRETGGDPHDGPAGGRAGGQAAPPTLAGSRRPRCLEASLWARPAPAAQRPGPAPPRPGRWWCGTADWPPPADGVLPGSRLNIWRHRRTRRAAPLRPRSIARLLPAPRRLRAGTHREWRRRCPSPSRRAAAPGADLNSTRWAAEGGGAAARPIGSQPSVPRSQSGRGVRRPFPPPAAAGRGKSGLGPGWGFGGFTGGGTGACGGRRAPPPSFPAATAAGAEGEQAGGD